MDTMTLDVEQSQYLTFRLGEEEFGVGILQVKEILEYGGITRVPMVPDFIRGVINLRGNVVPVVDLAMKFGMPKRDVTNRSCVVIVEVSLSGEQTTMGVLVDAVSQVMDILPQEIEAPPPFGAKIKVDFIQGMGKTERKFIILLDIDKVLSGEEMTAIAQAASSGSLAAA